MKTDGTCRTHGEKNAYKIIIRNLQHLGYLDAD